MGRATIISETGAGLYVIRPEYYNNQITSDISDLTANILDYNDRITTLTNEKNDILTEYDDKKDELDIAITAYKADPNEVTLEVMNTITQEIASITARLTNKTRELGREKLKKISAEKQKTKLESIVTNNQTTQNAWNVAYIEGLTGEVNTIEINGEPDQILIGDFTLSNSKLCDILGQSVAGSLYNFSLTPYWQKWNPTFRIGTITNISGSTAAVSLDAALSHYQSLDINQTTTLTNVPFSYLTCDEDAFEVGDEVVVGFTGQDWSDPVIIGFKDNPKECPSTDALLYHQVQDMGYTKYYPTYNWTLNDLGGQSPLADLEKNNTTTWYDVNRLNSYDAGAIQIVCDSTSTPDQFITILEMEFSYSVPDYTIRFRYDSDKVYLATSWALKFRSDYGITVTGGGAYQPNPGGDPTLWRYQKGSWLTLSGYTEGELDLTFYGWIEYSYFPLPDWRGYNMDIRLRVHPDELVGP